MELSVKTKIELTDGVELIDKIEHNDLFIGDATQKSIRNNIKYVKDFEFNESSGVFSISLIDIIPDCSLISYFKAFLFDEDKNAVPFTLVLNGTTSMQLSSIELRDMVEGLAQTIEFTNFGQVTDKKTKFVVFAVLRQANEESGIITNSGLNIVIN